MNMLERLIDLNKGTNRNRQEFWLDLAAGSSLYDELRSAIARPNGLDWERVLDSAVKLYRDVDEGAFWKTDASEVYDLAVEKRDRNQLIHVTKRAETPPPLWDKLGQEQNVLTDRLRRNGQVLVALIWCAWKVWQVEFENHNLGDLLSSAEGQAKFVQALKNEMEQGRKNGTDQLVIQYEDKNNLWGWISTFHEQSQPQMMMRPTTSVDFVGANPDSENLVMTLQLEILEGGTGIVFLHPADAFKIHCDKSFAEAMVLALRAACKRLERNPAHACGRFRVFQGGKSVPQVLSGNSAGGAAFRGWYHALQGCVADPELVVLAALKKDANGEVFGLDEVAGLERKVLAISKLAKHDTIVVANEVQVDRVQKLLKYADSKTMIRVLAADDQ